MKGDTKTNSTGSKHFIEMPIILSNTPTLQQLNNAKKNKYLAIFNLNL
ncbi:hypothetical protein SAMN05444364_11643 [Prevotella scopos JCM 17725]|uniref:Uncharacterized protein n=1 Tax=Prevotella scopos JCM 17725 TaxID=1236518 RepID=A0AAX2F4R3_9BACT|nr:hypothetical protein SAMN05444364_11643 [Prevotella scopos JCM 17725]